ncbi:MAG: virulence factor family protein [Methylovulum sp.]|uniref:virulence factor family protein n=1 Tax=Methylovulum sp. TaxID=1916980 RepID=UPI002633DD13|nr:AcvB/VirJ family lysyl-phosphatidylglycerol hydrolase [Methylovulum sp.]MDD2725637.1 virulence factor family protein [Methylovulum sp.]MDD5125945.1 virulence factor family protein [Methylovulum sp.]
MKIKKSVLVCTLLGLIVMVIGLLGRINPPVVDKASHVAGFGDITVARPLWGSKGLALVFSDTQKFPPAALGKRLASMGMTVAIIDSWQFFKGFNAAAGQCLDAKRTASSIDGLLQALRLASAKPRIVAGISEGALLPFLNAQSTSGKTVTNLAIDFSVHVPDGLVLCPALSGQDQNQKTVLVAQATLKGNWRSVWTDHPPEETAIFIKTLGNVDTQIAPYDTPLDTVLLDELKTDMGETDVSLSPMPIVEVPAPKPGDTLTIFYSGDGGWRDLDRIIAGEMAALNYPVAGVDALRYFWKRKSPEQTAADLSAMMAYYRKTKGIKSFVLAGYSFGADILPVVYNRLPQHDQDNVSLLVLLALAKNADFEIHVSGWLGQNAGELPQAPELAQLPKAKILCVYGKEETADTACTGLLNTGAKILELPGGHHFDQDYPKLTRQILDIYRQHGIN